MLALVALLQVSVATPPSLDDARRALHAADTAAAVAILNATIRADTMYDARDLAAFVLLQWIGRSTNPKYSVALTVWKSGEQTVNERRAFERWASPLAFIAMRNLADLDQGKDDRFIQEGPIHYVHAKLIWLGGRLVEQGIKETDSAVLGPGDAKPPGPAWQTGLRARADSVGSEDVLGAAGARWVAAVGWLSNLNRFAYEQPVIEAPLGCQDGCLLMRLPPADLPLLQRLRETGSSAARLDTLWDVRNRVPTIGRTATLDSLWAALNDLPRGPWPFSELAERMRVTVCALLRVGAESGCTPRTSDLDSVVAAELRVVHYEMQGRRRLSVQAMDAAPERFATLDRSLNLLLADSVATLRNVYVGGTYQPAVEWLRRRTPASPEFWQATWPLYLVPYNERLAAHRARLLLADMAVRFAIGTEAPHLFDAYGDPGTLVRVGVPLALARPEGRRRSGAPIVIYVQPGTHETIVRPRRRAEGVSLDFALAARSDMHPTSLSGFTAEDYDSFNALDHQVIRYTRDGRQDEELYTRWTPPQDCPHPEPRLGFFLLDGHLRFITKPVERNAAEPPRLKRFHLELAPGTYVYSIELLDRSCRVAERARYALTVPPVVEHGASDLMLVDDLHFGDERWVRRIDGRPPVIARPSLTVDAGDVIRFYWEVYGVSADAVQAARLQVRFEVVNVRNQRVAVREIRRLAEQARKQGGTLDLKYDLAVPPGDGPLGFGLAVGIPEGTKGVHVARVRVTDTRTKSTVTAERAFFVGQ